MIQTIAFYEILGLPMIVYGGATTLILLMTTAVIGAIHKSMKLHVWLARITVLLGLVHGIIGIAIFIK